MVHRPRPQHPHEKAAREPSEATPGLRAGLAVFAERRADVLRVAFTRAARSEIAELLRWAASAGVPCREVSDAELDRIAGSPHGEGLCVVARPRAWLSTNELTDRITRTRAPAVALDRVRNPYNIGAILRTAAFFEMGAVLLGAPAPHPGLAPTAVRVAEGGAELVALARTTDLADTLGRLRSRGVRVVGADAQAKAPARGFAFGRPVVLVVGHEREGLGERVRAQCDAVVAVRGGRGAAGLDSLNVAVAAGVLMAELVQGGASSGQ
jgi:TrmH RNA methyltransferase